MFATISARVAYAAAGAEMDDDWPSFEGVQAALDEALVSDGSQGEHSAQDMELLALMGVD